MPLEVRTDGNGEPMVTIACGHCHGELDSGGKCLVRCDLQGRVVHCDGVATGAE